MATMQLLKAYLDWQSEMGTEEVILPHPLARKQSFTSPGAASAVPKAPEGLAAETSSQLAPGLFASLARELEKAASPGAAPAILSLTGNGGPVTRGPEGGSLPVFPDQAGFWSYLEANPHLLQGETQPGEAASVTPIRMVRGKGPAGAALALIGFEPSEADAAEGKAFQGEVGTLLEKMMRAIRMDGGELYLSNLIKVRLEGKTWSRRELARIVPLLHAELALAQTPTILLLGQECAQAVLKTGKTLEDLRQETHRLEGREFFVTYHPQELLRKEELKRKAWEDLQWLQRRMAETKART